MDWFILASASALFTSCATLAEKKILFKIEALSFSFYISIVGLFLSTPFFFGITVSSITVETLIILYIKSILGTLVFLFVMLTLKNFEISKALPLLVITPGLTAIFAYLFLGDSLTAKETLGIILLMVGTYILEISGKKKILDSFLKIFKNRNYIYIFSAVALFTASANLDRLLLTDYKLEPVSFMALQQMFYAFNFTLLFLLTRKKDEIKSMPGKEILMWIILISLLIIGYRYTLIEATKLAPVALVLSVRRISVFFSALIGGKLFKEKDLVKRAVATIIMVAGALFLLNY